jgi:hypothetical protein
VFPEKCKDPVVGAVGLGVARAEPMTAVGHARKVYRFAVLNVLYRNRFRRVLENLQTFAKLLGENGVEYFVCGGFLGALLEGRIYRRLKDVDLNVDQKERLRLMVLLAREGISFREKWTGSLAFEWKGMTYDIIFFGRGDGRCIFENKPHRIQIEARESGLTDGRYCNAVFDKFHVRIMNPSIVYLFIYLVRNASHHKKKDLYHLAKYVSPSMIEDLLAENPQYREVCRSGFLDYSWTDWLKDELFCIFPAKDAPGP